MPQLCTVCAHPEKAAIDKALITGKTPYELAGRYGSVGRRAIQRHKENHLPQKLVKAQEREDVREALDVLQQLKAINSVSLAVLRDARATGRDGLALQAVDRVYKQIELQAKLLGELDERPQINVLMAPEWLVVRTALLQALAPYPDARMAVAGSLAQLEAGQ